MKKEWFITFKEKGVTYMQCKTCYDYISVSEDTTSVVCGDCNAKRIPWPNIVQKISTGRPAGWQWMAEFVDNDGNVFHKGTEQPKLKGTLTPTKVRAPKKRKKVDQDAKLFANAMMYKEKQKLKRAINKQKDFLNGKVQS